MRTDDYWENDELEDRLYHAQEHEKLNQQHHPSIKFFNWPFRYLRKTPIVFALLFLVIWWWMTSGDTPSTVDWSRFAYSQNTTDTQSLCNSLMVFEKLHKLKSKAGRVLMYPQEWDVHQDDINWWLMRIAERKFRVQLQPIQLIGADNNDQIPGTLNKPSDWNVSFTKIRTFELSQYKRVLHLDSDITLLQHLDELFLLPKTPIAMPRAYWSDGSSSSWPLTSLLMLVEPNPHEVPAMMEVLRQWRTAPSFAQSKRYDMDLLNNRFGSSAMVLPHRPYAMLTAEFRKHNHSTYLGIPDGPKMDPRGKWDPDQALKEAKLVHFSDWPLPKPWIMWPAEGLAEMQPDCSGSTKETCREREIWKNLYEDFRQSRKDLCKILPVPPPEWKSWKHSIGAG
jgi:hypothetical protein